MSDLDEIRRRLEKLRELNGSLNQQTLSNEDLQVRLDRLKGLNVSDGARQEKANYFVPNREYRTDVQQSDDLLEKLRDEVNIESRYKQANELEDEELYSKLSNLRMNNGSSVFTAPDNSSLLHNEHGSLFGFSDNFVSKSYDRLNQGNVMTDDELTKELGIIKDQMKEFNHNFEGVNSKNSSSSRPTNHRSSSGKHRVDSANFKIRNRINQTESSSEDEEKYVGIVKKFVDEVHLEERGQAVFDRAADQRKDAEDDGLDFCYICNEDAVLECKDCEDRYCINCFKEFHQDVEYRGHRYSRFNAKK